MQKKLSAHGESSVNEWTNKMWFALGIFVLNNAPWSDRPVNIDNNQIEILLENNLHYTRWDTAIRPEIFASKSESHLHQLAYVSHIEVWLPHKLKYLSDPISVYNSFFF